MYGPSPRIGDVDTRWHVTDSRTFEMPLERVRLVLPDALATVTKLGGTRRRLSIFDRCELSAEATEGSEGGARVDATVTFEASDQRVGALVMITTSVIGIPLGVAWRQLSVREARAHARATLDALWRAIRELAPASVYR